MWVYAHVPTVQLLPPYLFNTLRPKTANLFEDLSNTLNFFAIHGYISSNGRTIEGRSTKMRTISRNQKNGISSAPVMVGITKIDICVA
ncbi:hypothetical protein ACSBR2_010704 [Camellia fascicularis]